ncbi:hypothetical protein B0H11DRAFT_2000452, partial [Mycena galericulata]
MVQLPRTLTLLLAMVLAGAHPVNNRKSEEFRDVMAAYASLDRKFFSAQDKICAVTIDTAEKAEAAVEQLKSINVASVVKFLTRSTTYDLRQSGHILEAQGNIDGHMKVIGDCVADSASYIIENGEGDVMKGIFQKFVAEAAQVYDTFGTTLAIQYTDDAEANDNALRASLNVVIGDFP